MKILHVCKKYPNALGGDAVVVSNLQKQQESAGHQVAILTSRCPEIQTGPRIYKFGMADAPAALDHITLKRLISLAGLFFTTFRVLAKERPDVIHTHSIDMAFFVSFAARFFRIPLVHTFHIVTFYDVTQPALRRKSEVALAKLSGLRVITAPNARDVTLLQRAGLTQTVLLPNGVDLEFWRPAGRPAKGKTFTFISFGRLEAQKGCRYLVQAAALLANATGQTFKVVIAGEGSQKEGLENEARAYGVQDRFLFVGRKSPEEVKTLLRTADAAVFPSLYETTPLTLLEAWAMRVPVIATPVGILSDAAVDTRQVYLAQPKDEGSLFRAMQRCMEDEGERMTVATIGHKTVTQYAWPVIANQAENLYGSIVA